MVLQLFVVTLFTFENSNRHASCSRLLNPYCIWKLAYWGRWYSQLLRRERKKINLFSYELAYWKRAISETDSPYFAFRVVPLVKTYTKHLRRPNWSTPVFFRNIFWQNMRGKDMAEMGILITTPLVAVSASTTRISFSNARAPLVKSFFEPFVISR